MDRFGPTGKVSKKLVHLLRWSSFRGRTGLNFGWMDRAPSAHNARRYEQKAEGPGVFHGFRHNYFLGKENAIFKLRYVLSCNVMSLKVLGIVWVCTCWVALFMRWTPCVKPSRTRGLNQKIEIDLFSLYVSIYFTVSDHVMVPQRTFPSNFVLYTYINVHMYAQFTKRQRQTPLRISR